MSIDIDFVAGSHGNYLEFVLNKLVLGEVVAEDTPFDSTGASHQKFLSTDRKYFRCAHWFQRGGSKSKRVISISFTANDLLPLMSVSLLRAGNRNIDPHNLEKDTFGKLNNAHYHSIIDELNRSYGNLDSYNAIKADSWPNIDSLDEFKNLPQHIQDECNRKFEYPLFELSANNPNCPRNILREFFKIGFNNTALNGFMVEQGKMKYSESQKVFYFPFEFFYNTDKFVSAIEEVKGFFDLTVNEFDMRSLHEQFLERQIFKNSKTQADLIVDKINNSIDGEIGILSVLQEAYINSQVEQQFKKTLALGSNIFPQTINDLITQYEIQKRH